MRHYFVLLIVFGAFTLAYGQKGKVSGVIESDGEPLPGATIIVKNQPTIGTLTDLDGYFELVLDNGKYELLISYVGYNPVVKSVSISNKDVKVNVSLKTTMLDEVEIVADVARARVTPVAFTNVRPAKIEEELAGQDLPMVLNSTPGVYATQQGGGDGDARITIRGFDQRNIAVMLDGVPVNDMENGWVYWSNWFGLDAVTRNLQVQRGLGASKLGIPSVGGTMNILTKGIENKFSANVQQQITDYGYSRTSFGITSGNLPGNWGFTAAGSYKNGDGWAEMTYTKGYFYYLKLQKRIGKHMLSISGYGAPQEHAQRPYKMRLLTIDSEYALPLVGDTSKFNLPSQLDRGSRYNPHWGYIDRWNYGANGDTIYNGRDKLASKLNYYHKPQFSIKDTWSASDKFFVSNLVYLSIGKGGGTAVEGEQITDEGYYDFQRMYDLNMRPGFDAAGSYLKTSVNNHYWLGYLGFVDYQYSDQLNFSGGLDFRTYKAEHYREVYDLLGAKYVKNIEGWNPINHGSKKIEKEVGDKIDYYREGFVRWAGTFFQAEYTTANWTAFASGSLSLQGYQQVDKFAPRIVELDDTTFSVGLKYNPIIKEIIDDTVFYNGRAYTVNSPEAKYNTTDWQNFHGYTVKAGFNYNFTERINAFINTGHISKAPRFSNVFYVDNSLYRDVENEYVYAVELGASYKSKMFSFNINPYLTYWQNKPVDNAISIMIDDESYRVNVRGINARHMGLEIDFAYQPIDKVKFQGVLALGDWIYTSKDSAAISDDYGVVVSTIQYDAKGVHVGDAAQTQIGANVRFMPIKDLYIQLQGMYYDRYYANFDPVSLKGKNGGRDSWQIPAYFLMDFSAGYKFDIYKQYRASINFNILNLANVKYISDADNNARYMDYTHNDFDAKSASVFMGMGRRFSTSFKLFF